jgi:hypothetical protein
MYVNAWITAAIRVHNFALVLEGNGTFMQDPFFEAGQAIISAEYNSREEGLDEWDSGTAAGGKRQREWLKQVLFESRS